MPRKSKTLILVIGVLVLAAVGYSLLRTATRPNVAQGQEDLPPTPEPPDFAAFATSFCCDDGTPKYMTPSVEQIALLTEAAQTQGAVIQPDAPTITPLPPIEYLAPSGEWIKYTHPVFGYSFEYPANWYLSEDFGTKNAVAVSNYPLDQVAKIVENPYRFRVNIYQGEDIQSYASLEAYVNDPKRISDPSKLISQKSETLSNGYQIIRQEKMSALSESVLNVYIYNGKQVYLLAGPPLSSNYTEVIDHIISSLIIP